MDAEHLKRKVRRPISRRNDGYLSSESRAGPCRSMHRQSVQMPRWGFLATYQTGLCFATDNDDLCSFISESLGYGKINYSRQVVRVSCFAHRCVNMHETIKHQQQNTVCHYAVVSRKTTDCDRSLPDAISTWLNGDALIDGNRTVGQLALNAQTEWHTNICTHGKWQLQPSQHSWSL